MPGEGAQRSRESYKQTSFPRASNHCVRGRNPEQDECTVRPGLINGNEDEAGGSIVIGNGEWVEDVFIDFPQDPIESIPPWAAGQNRVELATELRQAEGRYLGERQAHATSTAASPEWVPATL